MSRKERAAQLSCCRCVLWQQGRSSTVIWKTEREVGACACASFSACRYWLAGTDVDERGLSLGRVWWRTVPDLPHCGIGVCCSVLSHGCRESWVAGCETFDTVCYCVGLIEEKSCSRRNGLSMEVKAGCIGWVQLCRGKKLRWFSHVEVS